MQQPDSQFVDNYVAAVRDEQSAGLQELWVNERLAQDFMRNAAATLRSGVLVMAITIFLLFEYVNPLGLGIWALVCALILVYRRHTLHQFSAMMEAQASSGQVANIPAFFRRHGWSWPASACVFALPVMGYYGKVPPANEYLCLMILVGIGSMGSALMAAHLKHQRSFSHALAITTLVAIGSGWFNQWPALPTRESIIFSLLVILFWVLILYLGKH
jgi:hypothetical protein